MSLDAFTSSQPRSRLERRVTGAAEELLDRAGSVSPIDVLVAIGWLPPSTIDRWQQGREEHLEGVAQVTPEKLSAALKHLRRWATGKGLTPSEVEYLAATRDRRPLRFTADGEQATERAWRTVWTSADLSRAARERMVRRQSKPPDLVVIEPLNQWNCTGCGGSGWLLFMEQAGPLCLDCADVCTATAGVIGRQAEYDASLIRPLLESCVAICRSCGDECERHAHMPHCQICAEACRRCERACRELLDALN